MLKVSCYVEFFVAMIDIMDIKITLELAALLKPLSTIHAMCIGGSVAEGYNDELSDIDLYIDIKDGHDEAIFIIIEQFLLTKGKLDVKFTEGITPPYSHCVYHIAGMDPMNYIEVTLHTHSNQFGMFDKLVIKVSVIPSERYSTSALPLSFTNGITAMDSICLGGERYL